MLNRATRTMRIIDFRAGSHPEKLELVHEVAEREGIERAFIVVEREESPTWTKLGFTKEGSIPGFYKRSDAYLLGMRIEPDLRQSGVRIRVKKDGVDASADRAERAYQAGRRMMRNRAPETLPRVKVAVARPQDIDKSLSNAARTGRALTDMAPFGRDIERTPYLCTARGGFSLLVEVEAQLCFDNAFMEILCAPRGDKETWLTASGLAQISEKMLEAGLVSAFAVTPAESVELTAALVAAGYRRTGRLPAHLLLGDRRVDAFLWSRKLAEPT